MAQAYGEDGHVIEITPEDVQDTQYNVNTFKLHATLFRFSGIHVLHLQCYLQPVSEEISATFKSSHNLCGGTVQKATKSPPNNLLQHGRSYSCSYI
jgi:hypothetical protein